MKSLIVYYSFGGNTKKIAEKIQSKIGGDIAEIKMVNPYTGDYNEIVEQGHDEVRRGYMPAIEDLGVDLNDYDTIILGTPVWWYTFAPAVKTLLNSSDLSGKKVYVFATNGGWIGHTFEDVKAACPSSNVQKGISIRFHGSRLSTSEKDIDKWIDGIK